MKPYRTRVRKMRKPGARPHDDPRTTYYDPDIRAAREAARRDSDTTTATEEY